ncbi:MAG TPA: helix-turn-helix transcriptional regulator [Gemmatimonadaceae bacterium]|nr:helix-turn-helix transcriptional regulator [Gemmatimonadaceae bacterium]
MSTEMLLDSDLPEGAPELTSLGKRLEILRIERGISKQHLARHAGTSRQQLWRVMTGKSELTSSLKDRLAVVLSVDPSMLSSASATTPSQTFGLTAAVTSTFVASGRSGVAPTISDYLADSAHLTATLQSLPQGDAGRRLKRALLNALEDLAVDTASPLPSDFSEIRRRVLAGEL